MMQDPNTIAEWQKAYICLPKNNLEAHEKIDEPKFYASYETDGSSPNMSCLLQHVYGKIWLREHNAYLKSKLKRITIPPPPKLGKNKKVQKTLKLKKETEHHKIKVEKDHHQNSPKLKKVKSIKSIK